MLVPYLVMALGDEQASVREGALAALEEVEWQAAWASSKVAALCSTDPVAEVRVRAARCLFSISGDTELPIRVLRAALASTDEALVKSAVLGAGQLGSAASEMVDELRALQARSEGLRDVGEQALRQILGR